LKRRELIKKIEAQGGVLIRHGGKHDWYQKTSRGARSRPANTRRCSGGCVSRRKGFGFSRRLETFLRPRLLLAKLVRADIRVTPLCR